MLDLSPPLRTGLITFWSLVFGVFYSGCCKSSFFKLRWLPSSYRKQAEQMFLCEVAHLAESAIQSQTPKKLPAAVQISIWRRINCVVIPTVIWVLHQRWMWKSYSFELMILSASDLVFNFQCWASWQPREQCNLVDSLFDNICMQDSVDFHLCDWLHLSSVIHCTYKST